MALQQPYLALLRTTGLLVLIIAAIWPAAGAAAGITLTWDYPAAGAAGFQVYCGTASRAYSKRIDVGNRTSSPVTGFTPGVRYYCATTAYDPAKVESGYSAEVSF